MVSKSILIKVAVGIVAVVFVWCLFNVFVKKGGGSATPVPFIPVVTTIPTGPLPEKFAAYDPEDDGDDNLLENYAEFIPAEVEEKETYVDAGDVFASPDGSRQLLDN
jgi:hypothetical protein